MRKSSLLVFLTLLLVFCFQALPVSAQFSPAVNDKFRAAMQDCGGGQPCLTTNLTLAAATPFTTTKSLNQLLLGAFQDCAGVPCLTVTQTGGVPGTGTVTQLNPATGVGTITNFGVFGFSSQTSTPTLTLTLTQAPAHTVFGNNTSSTAPPAYLRLACADLSDAGAGCSGSGAGVSSLTGTANQITASASTGAVTLSIPTNPTLPGTTTGTFSGSLTGNVTGTASLATALAANGTNCSAGSFPLGVDASGNAESCTVAFVSPLTTKGDLLAFSTVNARLPVGTDGQLLSADSTQTTGLKWVAAGAGSGTVNSGTTSYGSYYASTAAAVSPTTGITFDATTVLSRKDHVTTITTSTTLGANNLIDCSVSGGTDVVLTLPPASSTTTGHYVIVKSGAGAGLCTISASNGSDTLNGITNGTKSVALANEQLDVQLRTSTAWQVVLSKASVALADLTQASAASLLIGRGSASGAGAWQEISLGTGLTMTNQVLSSSGGSGTPGGSDTQIQRNNAGAFGAVSGVTANAAAFTTLAEQCTTVSTNTTLGTHLCVLTNASGAAYTTTVPVPTAATVGQIYHVTKIDTSANSITLHPASTVTLNGATTDFVCDTQYCGWDLESISATDWLVTPYYVSTVKANTSTSYTVVASDAGKLVTLSNASPVGVTLAVATAAGFGKGAVFNFRNLGAGTVTITPTTSQIDGASSITLVTDASAQIFSDGVNYFSQRMVATGGSGSGTVTQVNPATGAGTATNLGTFGFSSQTTTPTLTVSLTTAAAHTFFGNNSGSTAAPNYLRPACADLSDSTTACSTAIGTSGATLPLLSTANTWASGQVFVAPVLGTPASGNAANLTNLQAAQLSGTITSATQDLITRTGTLVSGATGAGFTIALTTSTLTGLVPVANGGTGLASGTSGGIPYYSGSTTIASSAALTANLPVIGGGAGAAPTVGTRSGNTTQFVTTTGALTSGDCVKIDANGNFVDALASCGSSGSGGGTIEYSAPSLTLTAGTRYAPPGGGGTPSTTESDSQVKAPAAMTISNFQVTTSAAPGTGNSFAFTWRKAGADQALTCTIADTATTCSDTTHSFNTALSDLIDVKIVSSGTIIVTPMLSWMAAVGTSGVGLTAVDSQTGPTITLTRGAGIGGSSSGNTITLTTASSEADFLASGALTCGAATQGKMQVHTTPLQYCDNAATPALQYAAYGNSAGAATTIVNGIALGTPASGVATNLTGTAAGLTAGTVTTNANLTGPITSTGNATAVAAQTGTGSTFVMQTAPTINGGVITGLTGLALRDTSAAFDVTLAAVSGTTLTAGRTLTLDMGNVAHTLVLGTTANTITFPSVASDTVVMLGATQTLTGKTLTSPTINGGTHTAITSLGVRDTSAAFDVTLAAVSGTTLTAGRTLTLDVGNVAHTLALGTTANTITFPNVASDTVVMLGATQTLTGKSIAASQITAGTFAAGTFSFSGSTLTTLGTVQAGALSGLTGLAIRDTSAAFDVTLAGTSSTTLTAGRTLTLDMGNVAHTLKLGTTANTITFPNAASFNVLTDAAAVTIAQGGTGQATANAAMNALSPLTTKGDLLAFSTVNARLPVGTDGQVLTADSTQTLGIKWAAAGGGVTSIATTSPITGGTITTTGTIACATCVTSAAALTNNQLVFGAGSQGTAIGDLTGDVTTSGGKATTIAAGSVTLAKMANIATATLIGRTTAGTGVPEALTVLPTALEPAHTGDVTNSAGSLAMTLASRYKVRSCTIIIGDPGASSPFLASDNDSPVACSNDYGSDWTITAVSCYANAGSPTVTPILTGSGSSTSILTGAITCGTASWAAGTVQSTAPVVHSFSSNGATCSTTPCTIDANITSAGLATKYIVIKIVGTI